MAGGAKHQGIVDVVLRLLAFIIPVSGDDVPALGKRVGGSPAELKWPGAADGHQRPGDQCELFHSRFLLKIIAADLERSRTIYRFQPNCQSETAAVTAPFSQIYSMTQHHIRNEHKHGAPLYFRLGFG